MARSYRLSDIRFDEGAKRVVRRPLGLPIFREADEAVQLLSAMVEDFKPPLLAAVGDSVALNLVRGGCAPDVAVVDFKTKRRPVGSALASEVMAAFSARLRLRNPRSTIARESWPILEECVRRALELGERVLVVVEGEEDLLTIPMSIVAPNRSFVVYGQPDEALVVVIVNDYTRSSFERLLERLVK